jgi:hypothetical protein
MKLFPPSLPADVMARCFVAKNGELGALQSDVPAFLDACRKDGADVLGWEAWIINYRGMCLFSPGSWTGAIPRPDGSTTVIGGDGGADEVQRQVALFNPVLEVAPFWLPHLRINITIG